MSLVVSRRAGRVVAFTTSLVIATIWVGSLAAQQKTAPALSAADYYEILDLNARFSHGLDSGADAGRMFASVFTSDGTYIDGSGRATQGVEQLAAMARATSQKSPTNLQHYVVNVKVDLVSGGATQQSYVQIIGPGQSGQPELVTDGGQYWDDLVRTADGWRFRRRTLLKVGIPRPEPSAVFTPNPVTSIQPTTKPSSGLTPLDRAEIFQLYAHYPFALDKALENGQMFANLFTSDGVMIDENGKATSGHDKLAEFVWVKGPTDVKTYITNIMLEQTTAGVNVRAYVMNAHIPPQPTPAYISPLGMFFDQLVKTPDGWRFKRKTLVAPHAAIPDAVAAAFKIAR